MDAYFDESETQGALRLVRALKVWEPSHHISGEPGFDEAMQALHQAIFEARKYLRRRHDGARRDHATETELSDLWARAGHKISPFDNDLGWLCYVKGNGWADDRVWSAPENKDLPLALDQMLERARRVKPNPPPKDVPNWFPIVGAIFTFLTIASLFFLIVIPSDIAAGKRIVFDVWVAVCVSASASFLGGTAKAKGSLPWPAWLGGKTAPIEFAAVGGVAVFIIALLFMVNIYH